MSLAGKPASRKRCAIASAAAVTLPTESVVLISISCLRMSCASLRVAASGGAVCAAIEFANNKLANSTRENRPSHNFRDPTFIPPNIFRVTPTLTLTDSFYKAKFAEAGSCPNLKHQDTIDSIITSWKETAQYNAACLAVAMVWAVVNHLL